MNSSNQYIGNSNEKSNNSGNLNRLNKKKSNSINHINVNSDHYNHIKHISSSSTPSQQHHLVNKIFSTLFPSQHLTFNQFVYCLKSIGIEVQVERKFAKIKTVFDELRVKGEGVIEYENGVRAGVKLLREEKGKLGSELTHLERGYYHMVVEGNHINIPCKQHVNSLSQLKSFLTNTSQLQYQSDNSQKKHLTSQSLHNIVKYLSLQQQVSQQTIADIMRWGDQQQKGYLTFEDIVSAIQASTVLNGDW